MSKYLFVSSHCDDETLCCGGTISKLVESGHEVHVRVLSHVYADIDLWQECESAMSVLDVTWASADAYPVRVFETNRQSILQTLCDIKKEINPDFVFTHSPNCFHQDHSTVGKESIRAFKHSNLLTFQGDWNERKFIKNYFVKLKDRHVQKKLDALKCYKSQQDRPYFKEEYLLGSLHVNGLMANCKYAEAFQVVNLHA